MTVRRATLLIFLVACTAFAQDAFTKKPQRVQVAPTPVVMVKQGGKAQVKLMFRVIPGFHINSNKPNSELLVPTKINFDVPTDISMVGTDYPDGKDYTFSFSPDEKLSVYTADFTVIGTVMAAKSTPKGTYRVRASLRYQACDDRACYPPTNVPFYFDVNVQKPAPTKARRNPAQSPHVH